MFVESIPDRTVTLLLLYSCHTRKGRVLTDLAACQRRTGSIDGAGVIQGGFVDPRNCRERRFVIHGARRLGLDTFGGAKPPLSINPELLD